MNIQWHSPAEARSALRALIDATGAVDGIVVRLRQPTFDDGPFIRQAWYDASRDLFVCSATARVLRDPIVTGWALA